MLQGRGEDSYEHARALWRLKNLLGNKEWPSLESCLADLGYEEPPADLDLFFEILNHVPHSMQETYLHLPALPLSVSRETVVPKVERAD